MTSQVNRDICRRVKKRVYLPDVDEFHSSSKALTGLALDSVLSVAPLKSKVLKEGYVADLTREGGISPCSMMLGLLYIGRLAKSNPKYIKTVSSRDLFLVSMMVASKYMNDEGETEALTSKDWAEIGSKPKSILNELEWRFLEAIDWKLYVPLEEYYSFVASAEGRIALQQATARGWPTYTDLTTIWDSSDLQNTMLGVSKQTAKVTCGSAAVYMMCIATLLAASQSMQVASEAWNSAITVPQPPSSTVHVNSSGLLLTGPPTMESHNHSCWPDEDTHMMMVLGGASRIQDEAIDVSNWQAPTVDVPIWQAPTADVPIWKAPTADVPTWQAPTADVPIWNAPTVDIPTWQAPMADVPTWQDRGSLFEMTWVLSMLLQCTYQWKEDHKLFGTVYKEKHASSVTTNQYTNCMDIGYTCTCGNKWQFSENETAYCCKNWYTGCENECIGHVNKYIDHENEKEYIDHEMKESSVGGNWTPSVAWLPDWSSDYFMTSFSSFLSILA